MTAQDTAAQRPAAEPGAAPAILGQDLTLAYDRRAIVEGLSVEVPAGSFTVVIGPNACGKSTLLRAMSKLLAPQTGTVLLDGTDIATLRAKEVAKRLGLLSQSALVPAGITVMDLVGRGRYAHQSLLSRWSKADEDAVGHALAATGMAELADRLVDELSGGQRQRAWVAMALAQQSPILLLDEPTTFLDIRHQLGLMDLFAGLNAEGRTLVAVVHDINHAVQYATNLVVMADGQIVAQGPPAQVVTPELLREVFGITAAIVEDPVNGGPLVVPAHGGHGRRTGAGEPGPARASAAEGVPVSPQEHPGPHSLTTDQ
ncbi:ABC transporter ATP-binding protein [Brevibacterium sp. BRM-1]|uniref:ABC transporter ATP-binding protein n=1 Tax=Brevibacterium sp. BRM-1 TaxID=2999062 RepID=UPI00227DA240|nr:ABC transporter ATP-binding protein [Brevibacterium sp. BRM-1]WAL40380.1 ABC transporter ATP-binding protein [Brevibacterium sp. BRM-1]